MRLFVLALACTIANPCMAPPDPQLPSGVTCEDIRAKVAEHGRAKAVLWARSHGYSWSEINEARKCLR